MKTRHFLTVAEKIEILDYHEKYKEISMRNLSAIFSQKYEKSTRMQLSIQHFTLFKLEIISSNISVKFFTFDLSRMYARSHDSLIIQCFEKRRDVNITQLIDVKGQPSKTVKYHHKLIWFCGLFANFTCFVKG